MTALGLTAPRAEAITAHAWAWSAGAAHWRPLPDVPGGPRVAASAVGAAGSIWVLGGYDVAPDRHETSHVELMQLDLARSTWSARAPLPVPIDDAAVVVWRDRFLFVVSGWSNDAPVSTVQRYDIAHDRWTTSTAFPGIPVFGHAAAIIGDELVVLDGVAKGPDGYRIVAQAWAGRIDATDPSKISWRDLGAHPGPPRYRSAAATTRAGDLVFHGGTSDPYNFDGRSYRTHSPSTPEPSALVVRNGRFSLRPAAATMDHRGLAQCGDAVLRVGGMTAGPTVSTDVAPVFR